MRNNETYFFDRDFDCDDDFNCCDDLNRRRKNMHDCEYDRCKDHDDYECDCRDKDRNCDKDHDCECKDRDCECKDYENCDHDDCRCDEDDCCESKIHCSERKDFNEDERFGCRVTRDAARSDDSWFDCQEEENWGRCRNMGHEEKCFCRKLKRRIQVLDFALQEVILFLDTHPCDREALRYYCLIRKKLTRLERLYECKCGPLTAQGVDTEYGWEWACCPWPWEGRE